MEPSDVQTAIDRRDAQALTFDPASGRMALGEFTRDLPIGSTNREVLNAYVELMARCRGDRIANLIDVRQADVEALATALDLDADDLDAEIAHVLQASRADALRLAGRMRGSRLISGLPSIAPRPTPEPTGSEPNGEATDDGATFVDEAGVIWPNRPDDPEPAAG